VAPGFGFFLIPMRLSTCFRGGEHRDACFSLIPMRLSTCFWSGEHRDACFSLIPMSFPAKFPKKGNGNKKILISAASCAIFSLKTAPEPAYSSFPLTR